MKGATENDLFSKLPYRLENKTHWSVSWLESILDVWPTYALEIPMELSHSVTCCGVDLAVSATWLLSDRSLRCGMFFKGLAGWVLLAAILFSNSLFTSSISASCMGSMADQLPEAEVWQCVCVCLRPRLTHSCLCVGPCRSCFRDSESQAATLCNPVGRCTHTHMHTQFMKKPQLARVSLKTSLSFCALIFFFCELILQMCENIWQKGHKKMEHSSKLQHFLWWLCVQNLCPLCIVSTKVFPLIRRHPEIWHLRNYIHKLHSSNLTLQFPQVAFLARYLHYIISLFYNHSPKCDV